MERHGIKMAKKRRRKAKGFKDFLIIYSSVLGVIILITWFLLYGLLKDYEAGRPSTTMDTIISKFTVDNIEELLNESGVTYSEFEDNKIVGDYLKSKLADSSATYKKKSGEYSEDNPVYVVYANDTAIAKVTLEADGKNGHNFTKWKMGSISFDEYADKKNSKAVTLNVPKGSTVKLNNIDVSESYITADDQQFDPCKHVSNYVTTPVNTVYTVSNLLVQPQISVQLNGVELTVNADTKQYIYSRLSIR